MTNRTSILSIHEAHAKTPIAKETTSTATQLIRRRLGSLAAAVVALGLLQGSTRAKVVEGSDNVPAASGARMGRDAVRRGVQSPGGLFTARFLLLVDASK